ncbi:RNA polymerase sigma factor [Pseudooceanicola sp.]|uniref:RNA polymerase sigma factor n=1 Tax=Pseudooceanicola sp. TaxID=1914328 RepID=UPI0035C6BA22
MPEACAELSDPRKEIVDHLSALRAFALSLTGNRAQADDLVQDTVVKAWQNIDKFKAGTNLRAWLFTIQRNHFYSQLRKARREVQDSDGEMVATLSEKPAHDGRLAMNDFQRAFAKLTAEQREALVLVGASGFSYEDAAKMCGVKTGTIKSRVNRARKDLVAQMQLDQGEALELTDKSTMAVINSRISPQKGVV